MNSRIGIQSYFSNYITATRFDAYNTVGEWIILDTLRFGYRGRIHRIYLHRKDIDYIECGKHLSINMLLISLALIVGGIIGGMNGMPAVLSGLIVLAYTLIAYYSAGLIFHTSIGMLCSGPFLKENNSIFDWYIGADSTNTKSELLTISNSNAVSSLDEYV